MPSFNTVCEHLNLGDEDEEILLRQILRELYNFGNREGFRIRYDEDDNCMTLTNTNPNVSGIWCDVKGDHMETDDEEMNRVVIYLGHRGHDGNMIWSNIAEATLWKWRQSHMFVTAQLIKYDMRAGQRRPAA